MFRKSGNELGEGCDLQIPFICFNYTSHDHVSTGYSAFYPVAHGCHPRTPQLILSSSDAPIPVGPKSSSPAVKEPQLPKPTLTLAESDWRLGRRQ